MAKNKIDFVHLCAFASLWQKNLCKSHKSVSQKIIVGKKVKSSNETQKLKETSK